MTKRLQVFKCQDCAMVVEALQGGECELVCGGKPMALQQEKTEDSTKEKHVPYVEQVEGGYKVRIGQNAAHPMEEKHYIQWIQLLVGGKAYRQFLKPGDAPEAFFCVCDQSPGGGQSVSAREYCNIHGLWKS